MADFCDTLSSYHFNGTYEHERFMNKIVLVKICIPGDNETAGMEQGWSSHRGWREIHQLHVRYAGQQVYLQSSYCKSWSVGYFSLK